MKSWLVKVLGALALLFVVGTFVSQFYNRHPAQIIDAAPTVVAKPEPAELTEPGSRFLTSSTPSTTPSASFASSSASSTIPAEQSVAQDKTEQANPRLVPHEKIEEYLRLHSRDGASLLAAFHVAYDPEHPKEGLDYLREAAARFPGDSRVQLAMLAQDAFSEEHGKWLDAFKASAPGNSLADYLSANDYFKNNQPDAAIKELLAASGKQGFADFAMESYLDAAELSRLGGASSLVANTAAMSAVSQDLLPELSNIKALAQGILDLQKQYVSLGDTASAENLAQMSVDLANRLTTEHGGIFVISQMEGMAIESIALQSLNQNATYEFLEGKTPAQRLEEIKLEGQEMRALTVSFTSAYADGTEAERDSYTERLKMYGELSAMRWLSQLHPASLTEGEK